MPSTHKCSYFKCQNHSNKKSMFRFPSKKGNILEEWLKNCGNIAIAHLPAKQLRSRYICIDHFKAKYIHITPNMHKSLSKNAVPVPYQDSDTNPRSFTSSPVLQVLKPTKVYGNGVCNVIEDPITDADQTVDLKTHTLKRRLQGNEKTDTPECKRPKNTAISNSTVKIPKLPTQHQCDHCLLYFTSLEDLHTHVICKNHETSQCSETNLQNNSKQSSIEEVGRTLQDPTRASETDKTESAYNTLDQRLKEIVVSNSASKQISKSKTKSINSAIICLYEISSDSDDDQTKCDSNTEQTNPEEAEKNNNIESHLSEETQNNEHLDNELCPIEENTTENLELDNYNRFIDLQTEIIIKPDYDTVETDIDSPTESKSEPEDIENDLSYLDNNVTIKNGINTPEEENTPRKSEPKQEDASDNEEEVELYSSDSELSSRTKESSSPIEPISRRIIFEDDFDDDLDDFDYFNV